MKTLLFILLISIGITINGQSAVVHITEDSCELYYKDVIYEIRRVEQITDDSKMVVCSYKRELYKFIIQDNRVIVFYNYKDKRWYEGN